MFWAQIEDSSISDLLIKEDVSLEEVLDHDSLLQECRSQNDNLIKLLTEKQNYYKLLKHVLVTPNEDFEENIRFKYSSLSCEVLTSDIPAINSLLIKGFQISSDNIDFPGIERPYFDQLYDILNYHDTMNPLTISFCIKILLNILKFDNEAVMKLMSEKVKCIDIFLTHIDSNAIVHFFTEFVQCEDDVVEIRKQWLADNKLVLKLANLLGVTEYRDNSVQVLFSNILWHMSLGLTNRIITNELRTQLNEKEFLDILFVHISSLKSDSSLVSTCLKVVRNIVEMENKIKEEKLTCCIELIHKNFNSFINLLRKAPKQMYDLMPTTVGVFQPFGPTRIEIVNLMEALFKNESKDIIAVIIESQILDVLLNFVSEYKWNSQFHLSLLRALHVILSDVSVGNRYYDVQKYLIQKFGIYHWFIELYDSLETFKPRPGYSGILWKIGNLLDSLKNSTISIDLLSEDSEIADKWSNIVNNYLVPKNAYSEKKSVKIDSELKELDLDLNIVEINEADICASGNNQDEISDFFRGKSDNLDDIFGASLIDNDDGWVNNDLEIPNVPIDDFTSNVKEALDSDDSTSSDEESPAVIRQNPKGNAAKYILSGDFHNSNTDLNDLPDIPDSSDIEFSSLEFNDPWELKPPSRYSEIAVKWSNVVENYIEPKNDFVAKTPLKINKELKDLVVGHNNVKINESENSGNNQNSIIDPFRDKSDTLDDIFEKSVMNYNKEERLANILMMPRVPVDDFTSDAMDLLNSDDSTSSDELSPAVIRQNFKGIADKYVLTDFHTSYTELNDLCDIPDSPDIEFSSLKFIVPQKLKSSSSSVQDNWAQF